MNVLIVGQGPVGRALFAGLNAVPKLSVTSIGTHEIALFHQSAEVNAVIYAGGPAGEAACRFDPETAFKQHYINVAALTEWASGFPPKRLVVIGTVLSGVGFYPALKQLGLDYMRDRATAGMFAGSTIVFRCGQIIGPEMPQMGGVVGTWLQLARSGGPLVVHCKRHAEAAGACEVGLPLTITLCADLIARIRSWLTTPTANAWEEERVCMPDPIPLRQLAMVIAHLGEGPDGATVPVVWSCRPKEPAEQHPAKLSEMSVHLLEVLNALATNP